MRMTISLPSAYRAFERFPFHPTLIARIQEHWAAMPDFQRTRTAHRSLAACLLATHPEGKSRATFRWSRKQAANLAIIPLRSSTCIPRALRLIAPPSKPPRASPRDEIPGIPG